MLRLFFLLAFAAGLMLPGGTARAQYFQFGKNRVQYESHAWRYVQSEHFDVYFYERDLTAPGGRILATFAARAAEEAYVEVAELFRYEIADRIPILVYPSHNDFAVTNVAALPVGAEGIGGVTELFKNRIALPFTGDWRDFRRVLHHELVHAVINDIFYGGSIQSIIRNNIRLRIPLWFNEGLAEYSALGWDTQSDMYLRDAVLNDYLPEIEGLSGFLAYRGGQGVWDFIAEEYGREKVSEILERLRLTRSVPTAFREATGLTLDELSERWLRTLKVAYYPEAAAREALDVVGRPLATTDEGGSYHASPAMAPQGDKVAYVAATDGRFGVYVVPTSGSEPPRKLIGGQDNPAFESLRILTPGLGWSPDGERLAMAVKSGSSDAVALVDVRTRQTEHIRIPGIDAILSVAWSPEGERLALGATAGAHSDIYVHDLATGTTINVTGDLYADHEPAWSPDGQSLVFHSDRGDSTLTARAANHATGPGGFDPLDRDFSAYSLYRLRLDQPGTLERLTHDPTWDERAAAFAGPEKIAFVSDRNGIPNLYEKNLTTGTERPLTNLETGVIDFSLSADGRRAALAALDEGTPSIFLLRNPFERGEEVPDTLAPNVWAARVTGGKRGTAPSLQIASAAARRGNALLRDAADGVPFEEDPLRRALPAPDSVETDSVSVPDSLGVFLASLDTSAVDFRAYAFSDAFDEAAEERLGRVDDRFDPPDPLNPDGSFRIRRYKLRFSPDLVYATGGYDTVFGVRSITQMLFSDMLGNHRVALATNLVLDLRNSDYLLSYQSLARRTDYTVEGFHLARELADFSRGTVYRYRNYGLVAGASYPLDTFRRLDGSVSLLGVSLADLSALGTQPRTRSFIYPRLAFTSDHTVPGFLAPRSGRRWAASVAGSPGPSVFFATALADARQYVPLGALHTLALRFSSGASVGPNPQRFYAAGVQNWINARYETLPIEDPDDFVFATPVLPLRGYRFNEAVGDRFALVNAELRAPLIAALLPGPIPLVPLYRIQAVGFVDAGVLAEDGFDLWRVNAEGKRVFNDVLAGAGVGLRTLLLGYPVRLDWAWPYDGRGFGDERLYFSVGLDF